MLIWEILLVFSAFIFLIRQTFTDTFGLSRTPKKTHLYLLLIVIFIQSGRIASFLSETILLLFDFNLMIYTVVLFLLCWQFFLTVTYENSTLGVFILPLTLFYLFYIGHLPQFSSIPRPEMKSIWFDFHLIGFCLAYTGFSLGFCFHMNFLMLQRSLKNHKFGNVFLSFFPLKISERGASRFNLFGFCFLSLGIFAVVIWAKINQLGPRSHDPKVFWTFVSWGFYALFLVRRFYFGNFGVRNISLSLLGFLTLLYNLVGTVNGVHIKGVN